ncbi:MAG TPA: cation:proton antiporter [Hanamia sp.]|nr:cation:proton antiporter [Hanamia sp.]
MTITIIIIISILLLIAYLFDLTSSRTKIPSVILLLLLGWAGRQVSDFISFPIPDLTGLLPIFGTLGLILIVLEGALELELNRSKFKLIRKSFFGAFVSMLVLSFIVSYAFYYFGNFPLRQSLINAIPLCIISSSVAISSARNLSPSNKEFIIYESSLSDILGVLFFNFMVLNSSINGQSFLHFGIQVVIICVVSFIATLGLSFLLRKIDHPIKHAPIIILLILIYAISEIYHLPALIFILFFGLFLGNIDEMKNFNWIKKLNPYEFNKEVSKFREIVIEGAFLIRAFFFTLFGYSFETKEILHPETFGNALLISAAIIIIRAAILKISKLSIFPLLFIAPRGLITILLFFAIPASQTIPMVNKSLIIQVIILTVLFMMIGVMLTGRQKKIKGKTIAGNIEEENSSSDTFAMNEETIPNSPFPKDE